MMKVRVVMTVVFCLLCTACASKKTINRGEPQPPRPKQLPHVTEVHGQRLVDAFHWLKDKTRTDPEVIAHIEAENAYTEAVMAPTTELREALYEEIIGRIKQTDLSVPARRDDYYYYDREEEGRQYTIYCRKHGSMTAPEEIILDLNELSEGSEYCALGMIQTSPNHRMLCYTLDTTGNERYTMFIKDLQSGELLPDRAFPVSDFQWANDNRTLFYTTINESERTDSLFRHVLGAEGKDELLYFEKDEAFYIWVDKTRSKRLIALGSASKTTSETWLL
ncbi:oligopeptidase B, partial [bacterium]|nr:oligopeptidase B [candidate division CSSED10-310 bacterium]